MGLRHIETPEGHDSLTAFLQASRDHLMSLHITRHHPVGQSLQHGTQALDDLFSRDEPVIDALKVALANAVRSFTEGLLSSEEHPLARRQTGQIAFSDPWSVLLRNKGFHKNHYHSHVVSAGGEEGWIKFGERGFVQESRSAPSTGCNRRKVHWLFSPLISGTAPRRYKATESE